MSFCRKSARAERAPPPRLKELSSIIRRGPREGWNGSLICVEVERPFGRYAPPLLEMTGTTIPRLQSGVKKPSDGGNRCDVQTRVELLVVPEVGMGASTGAQYGVNASTHLSFTPHQQRHILLCLHFSVPLVRLHSPSHCAPCSCLVVCVHLRRQSGPHLRSWTLNI